MSMQAMVKNVQGLDRTYRMVALSFVGCIGIAIGGYFIYQARVAKREQQAHMRFADSFDILFQAGAAGYDEKRKKYQQGLFQEAELAFHAGHQHHKGAYLAPYFLVMKAVALLKQGKRDEALEHYQKAVKLMPASSPLKNLYATSVALMQIDNEATHEVGLKQLQQLAQDTANIYRDVAQYYLGSYYWSGDDIAQAKSVWQALVNDQRFVAGEAASPWAELAQTQLAQLP